MDKKRLWYLDNLKIFLTCLVIIHHVGQGYGMGGESWYHCAAEDSVDWLSYFFPVNASYFMGLFFMISGYFIPTSYDKKGAKEFIKTKCFRMLLPLLFIILVVMPIGIYFCYVFNNGNEATNFFQYYINVYIGIGGESLLTFEHGWYMQHLIIYALIYCCIRKIFIKVDSSKIGKINYIKVLIIAILLSVITSVVRVIYPIDTWIDVLGFIGTEVAHLPQYVIFFSLGILAKRNRWFEELEKEKGYILFGVGLLMASVVLFGLLLPNVIITGVFQVWPWYESFMAVTLSFGLIVLFREKVNKTNKILKVLAETSFTAYILHMAVVLGVQVGFDKIYLGATTVKYIVVSVISIILTYLLAIIIHKIKSVII